MDKEEIAETNRVDPLANGILALKEKSDQKPD